MSIRDYSIDQLEAELERRKYSVKEEAPSLRSDGDLESEIVQFATSFHEWYTLRIAKDGHEPKDGTHFAYEMLIDFLYGRKYWDWFNDVVIR